MKRTPLAVAALIALTGAAHAQSSVTLFGTLDAGAYSKQLSGETRIKNQWSGGMTTSHWGLRGTEDLGGGMAGLFSLSSFIRVDTGEAGRSAVDAYWGRWAWVGLQAPWGTVRLGRQSSASFVNSIRFSAFGESASFGSGVLHTYLPSATQPLMTGSGATDSAWNNLVSYTSPDLKGFVATVGVAAGEGTTAGRRAQVGLSYLNQGPIAAGLTIDRIDKASLNFSKPPASILMTDADTINAGIAYDFKVAKLFGQYIRTQLENTTTKITLDTKQVGASVPIVQGFLLASFGRTDKEQTAAADQKRDTIAVGYDYFLSKRTDLYAVAQTDKVTGLKRGTGYAVGLRHRF